MGHLINPISLRLGINRIWVYTWYANNIYEYNYLTLQQTNIESFLKKFFDLNIFPKRGYLLSHVNFLYFSKYIDIRVYLYKTINNLNFKIFRIRKLSRLLTKFFYKTMFYNIILKLKIFFYYYFSFFYFLLLDFRKKIEKINHFNLKKEFFLVTLYIILKRNRFCNFFILINSFIFFKYKFKENDKEKQKKSIKFFKSSKQKIFIEKDKYNQNVIKIFNSLILKIFFWFLKFKFWKKITFFINFFFTKFIQSYVILRICKVNYLGVNINIIGLYIVKRLKQRFKVVELIMPIIRNLRKNKNLIGFKFSFCGRFSRKEMATTEFFSYAAVPFNTLSFFIDYTFIGVILKDSYCGIKIWLNKKKDKFYDLFFHTNNLIWKIIN